MKVFYSEEALKTLSLKDLADKGIELSKEITDAIYKDPLIGNLTSIAEWCGLYSAYFIGDQGVYFVFGFNQKSVHRGKYVEGNGLIWPESYVKDHGFLSREGFLFRDWNARVLPTDTPSLLKLQKEMRILEMLRSRYTKAGFQMMPEGVLWDGSYMQHFNKFLMTTENDAVVHNQAYEKLLLEEKAALCDLAVWQWPMSVDNYRLPGFIAWTRSRYCPQLGSENTYEKQLKVYKNPQKWEDAAKENLNLWTEYNLYLDECSYIAKGLENMHIPFKVTAAENDKVIAYNQGVTRLVEQKLSDYTGRNLGMKRTAYLAFHPSDYGAVQYLSYMFTNARFTKEQNEFGDRLYSYTYSSQYPVNKEHCFASYMFYVPYPMLDDFKAYAKSNDIRYGHPTAASANTTGYYEGVNLIVEAFDMSIVEDFLFCQYDYELNTHLTCGSGKAPFERRNPSKLNKINPEKNIESQGTWGAFSRTDPWHYDHTTFQIKDTSTGEKKTVGGDLLKDESWWVPTFDYDKKGLHVYNSKALEHASFRFAIEDGIKYINDQQETEPGDDYDPNEDQIFTDED